MRVGKLSLPLPLPPHASICTLDASVKTAVTMSAELQILSLVILEIVIMVVKLVILFDISKLAANGMGEVVGIVEVFLYLWICV